MEASLLMSRTKTSALPPASAISSRDSLQLFFIARGKRDGGALRGEGKGAGASDALRCSGDECDLVGEFGQRGQYR